DENLGRRRLGIASGEDTGGGFRRGLRPGWPHQGATGLLTARPSGGVCGRRHDELQRPAWRIRGCAAIGSPCCLIIRNRVRNGAEPTPFKYRALGSMAAVDSRTAILSVHGVRLSGRIAWLLWLIVHITFMTGFMNRFTALIHWLWCFVGTARCERAIAVEAN